MCSMPLLVEHRGDHAHVGPGQQGLDQPAAGVDAAGHGQRGLDAAVEDGNPAQRQQQLVGCAQDQARA